MKAVFINEKCSNGTAFLMLHIFYGNCDSNNFSIFHQITAASESMYFPPKKTLKDSIIPNFWLVLCVY